MGKHHGKKSSPGSKTPCPWRTEKPQNCTSKMPNVTSETDRKWCFWLLFPLAAAMNFGHLYSRSPNGKTQWKKSPPGSKTPCLGRTEKPQNCISKMPIVTSETHRKWWWNDAFGYFFSLLLLLWILATFCLLLQRLLVLRLAAGGCCCWCCWCWGQRSPSGRFRNSKTPSP